MTSILCLLAVVVQTESPDVRRAVEASFKTIAPVGAVDACVREVSAAISGVADEARRRKLLEDLPNTVEYHRFSLMMDAFDAPEDLPDMPPGPESPGRAKATPAERAQAASEELEYLAARVRRAARVRWTDATRAQAVRQFESLEALARATLLEKFPGEPGADLVRREARVSAKGWIGTLDLPYNAFIDRPLTEAELTQVKDAIRKAAADFKPVTFSAHDVHDRPLLQERGVPALFQAVREAPYRMCALCFEEYAPYEAKADARRQARKERLRKAFPEKK